MVILICSGDFVLFGRSGEHFQGPKTAKITKIAPGVLEPYPARPQSCRMGAGCVQGQNVGGKRDFHASFPRFASHFGIFCGILRFLGGPGGIFRARIQCLMGFGRGNLGFFPEVVFGLGMGSKACVRPI